MILVAGGSGMLGAYVVSRFTARKLRVRVDNRDPSRVRTYPHLQHDLSSLSRGMSATRCIGRSSRYRCGDNCFGSPRLCRTGSLESRGSGLAGQRESDSRREDERRRALRFDVVIGASATHPMSLFA